MPYNTETFNKTPQMSTRGRIGIQLSNGSVLSVYHHWDSYPDWLGRVLKTHYNTKEKVEELIDGGDMSSCWTQSRWNTKLNEEYGPEYYSQRGEDFPPRFDENVIEYIKDGEEYAYLFRDGEWICWDRHQFEPELLYEVVQIPSAPLFV